MKHPFSVRQFERSFRQRLLCSIQVNDDLYMGSATPPIASGSENPTAQPGAGPMGRLAFLNIIPKTVAAATLVALQHTVAATALTLVAGTNITLGTAPDGSGASVYVLDCARCVSLTSSANMSAQTVTLVGYDNLGRKTSQTINAPNANTVHFTKAVISVLSLTPSATDGTNSISAGVADVFGLPFFVANGAYLTSVKWDTAVAQDAGTFTAGDTTTPATTATTDPRGLYAPSSASNGTRQLIIAMHLDGGQCGPSATTAKLLGVTPV